MKMVNCKIIAMHERSVYETTFIKDCFTVDPAKGRSTNGRAFINVDEYLTRRSASEFLGILETAFHSFSVRNNSVKDSTTDVHFRRLGDFIYYLRYPEARGRKYHDPEKYQAYWDFSQRSQQLMSFFCLPFFINKLSDHSEFDRKELKERFSAVAKIEKHELRSLDEFRGLLGDKYHGASGSQTVTVSREEIAPLNIRAYLQEKEIRALAGSMPLAQVETLMTSLENRVNEVADQVDRHLIATYKRLLSRINKMRGLSDPDKEGLEGYCFKEVLIPIIVGNIDAVEPTRKRSYLKRRLEHFHSIDDSNVMSDLYVAIWSLFFPSPKPEPEPRPSTPPPAPEVTVPAPAPAPAPVAVSTSSVSARSSLQPISPSRGNRGAGRKGNHSKLVPLARFKIW